MHVRLKGFWNPVVSALGEGGYKNNTETVDPSFAAPLNPVKMKELAYRAVGLETTRYWLQNWFALALAPKNRLGR